MKHTIALCIESFALLFLGVFLVLVTHFAAILMYSVDVQPEFQTIYQSFLAEAKTRGYDMHSYGIDIHFAPKMDSNKSLFLPAGAETLGGCQITLLSKPTITVSHEQWVNQSRTQREMIIFHELGHCFMLKGHTDDIVNNHKKSLMSTMIFNQRDYLSHRKEYLDEIFSFRSYHVKDYAMTFFVQPTVDHAYTLETKVKMAFNPQQ